ncbi:Transglutaminase-like superfamily protein [Methanobrevibacter olleyae]|uniref:Transglutaminase-like superfamily protein n=1 Tax=Methanobrevibacter olleyae TaxID=294671 RepID=A0A1I4K2C6_METOL|nr:transglutaminase-like domain-containing protein [Methanobrevibacter olleyae]SFL72922.1 Transglutaminase-like superfamily protein [Methanobrevibacter olleyae]
MITIKNLTLLLAVLFMGFCLISSVSAMDNDSSSLTGSNDLSGSSVSSSSNGGVASVSSSSNNGLASDSNLNNLESNDISSSNVNSENEVLSTDNTAEDSNLKHDLNNKNSGSDLEDSLNNKNSKNILSSSSDSSNSPLQAKAKTKTTLKGSSNSLYKGNYYTISLKDSNGKALSGQKLSFNIGGKTYTLTTDSKGSSYLQINLKEGKYSMLCSYAGSDLYSSSSLSLTLSVLKNPNAFTVKEIETAAGNVKKYVLKNKRLPNTVKVGSKTLKISEFSYLSSKAIANLNSNNKKDIILLSGISNGKSPSTSLKTTVYKAQYLDLANNVVSYISSKKVAPSESVVKDASKKSVGKANFNLYTFAFARILDFHKSKNYLPKYCTFESSVFKQSASLKSTTIKGSSNTLTKGSYYKITLSDSSGKVLSGKKVSFNIGGKTYSLTTDSKGSSYLQINLKEGKYAMLCSYAGSKVYKPSKNSVTLTVLKNPNAFTVKEIETAAGNVKKYVLKNKRLPNTVKVGSKTLKISEFSYLSSKAIVNLNSNNKKDIVLLSGISNGKSSSASLKSNIYKAQYVDLAKRSYSNIESKKVPSSYISIKYSSNKVANVNFNLYTFAFSKVLDFHKSKNYLPKSCTFESSVFGVGTKKATSIKTSSNSINKGDAYSVTLVDNKGKGLANQKITFTISGKSYGKTTNSNGVASININLNEGKYSVVSSFGGSSTYKASKFSNTITIKSNNRFSISEIESAATSVKTYVNSNKVLPSTVTVANKKLSISQFSYLMAKAVYNINAGNANYITLPTSMSNCNSLGDNIDTTVYKAQYIDLTKRVVSFEESNKAPPVYAKVYSSSGSSIGNVGFNLYTYAFSKVLDFHKTKKYLPKYCTFESSVFKDSAAPIGNLSNKINYNSSQFKNGLNEKNTESDLSKYLVGTGQSAITSSIKDLATKLTKGLTSTDAKAQAIYNYVRDEIDYSYYANSKYGASGTLSKGSGNCVDQASLVVALCRASGIHARYAHAKGCTFSSGLVTGHVWAQVLVNGVWYSADATSVRNGLGNIVNWNTRSYSNLNKYAAVPF